MKKKFTMALVSLVALGLCAGCEFSISKEGSKSNSNSNVASVDCNSNGYKQSDFIGTYSAKGTNKVTIEKEEVAVSYYLSFYEDGTYGYTKALTGPGGHVGTYVINGDKITLYPVFETAGGTDVTVVKESVKYEISIKSKDELDTSNLTDKDAVSMKKSADSQMNSSLRHIAQSAVISR